MMKSIITNLVFSLAVASVLSSCAMKEPPSSMAAFSSVPTAPSPSPPSAPVVSTVPPRPAIGETVVPGSLRDFEVNVGDRVFFAFDKSGLEDSARTTLKKQAAWLQKYPAVIVTVGGYCDERGTREYNLAFGARRAAAVKDYLVSFGVATQRLQTISFGKERPVCVESSENCWSQNRRAVSSISNAALSSDVAIK